MLKAWLLSVWLLSAASSGAPRSEASRHYTEGARLHRGGDKDGALVSYTAACAADPTHAKAQQFRGQLLLTSDPPAYGAAAEAYAAAIVLRAARATAGGTQKRKAKQQQQQPAAAATASLHNNLGAALAGAGRNMEAAAAYRRSLVLEPAGEDAGANLRELKAKLREQLLGRKGDAKAGDAKGDAGSGFDPAPAAAAASAAAVAELGGAFARELARSASDGATSVWHRSHFHATPFFAVGVAPDDDGGGGDDDDDEEGAEEAGGISGGRGGFAGVLPRAHMAWLNRVLLRSIRALRRVHEGVTASNSGGGWQSAQGMLQGHWLREAARVAGLREADVEEVGAASLALTELIRMATLARRRALQGLAAETNNNATAVEADGAWDEGDYDVIIQGAWANCNERVGSSSSSSSSSAPSADGEEDEGVHTVQGGNAIDAASAGGFNAPHGHPSAVYSGVYFVTDAAPQPATADDGGGGGGGDGCSCGTGGGDAGGGGGGGGGGTLFTDPRMGARDAPTCSLFGGGSGEHNLACLDDSGVAKRVVARAGTLLLWPAWLEHAVEPSFTKPAAAAESESESDPAGGGCRCSVKAGAPPRVSIAFNVWVEKKAGARAPRPSVYTAATWGAEIHAKLMRGEGFSSKAEVEAGAVSGLGTALFERFARERLGLPPRWCNAAAAAQDKDKSKSSSQRCAEPPPAAAAAAKARSSFVRFERAVGGAFADLGVRGTTSVVAGKAPRSSRGITLHWHSWFVSVRLLGAESPAMKLCDALAAELALVRSRRRRQQQQQQQQQAGIWVSQELLAGDGAALSAAGAVALRRVLEAAVSGAAQRMLLRPPRAVSAPPTLRVQRLSAWAVVSFADRLLPQQAMLGPAGRGAAARSGADTLSGIFVVENSCPGGRDADDVMGANAGRLLVPDARPQALTIQAAEWDDSMPQSLSLLRGKVFTYPSWQRGNVHVIPSHERGVRAACRGRERILIGFTASVVADESVAAKGGAAAQRQADFAEKSGGGFFDDGGGGLLLHTLPLIEWQGGHAKGERADLLLKARNLERDPRAV
jgi:hypothetical protein